MPDSLRRLVRLPHRVALLVAAIVAGGFALRLFRLDQQSIWWDEAYSIDLALRPITEATALTAVDIHPPLHYWLLAAWVPLTGVSEYAVRSSSVFWGVLTIPLMYQLGRALFGKPAGVLAAFLFAIHPFHVAYAQEARMYTLETALSVLSVLLMVRLFQAVARDEPLWWPAAAYAGATSLALWADYFPVFVIAVQGVFGLGWGLWWLWRDKFDAAASPRPYHLTRTGSAPVATAERGVGLPSLARRQARRLLLWWVGANLAAAVLYLPWAVIAWQSVTGYGVGRITTPPVGEMLLGLWTAYFLGQSVVPGEAWWLAALGIVAALLALVILVVRKPKPATWAIVYLLGPLVIFLLVLVFRPFFNERYAFVATPALVLLVAGGLAAPLPWVRQRLLRRLPLVLVSIFLLIAAVSLANHYTDPRFQRDDLRSLHAWLVANTGPEDVVLLQTRHPFSWLMPREDIPPLEATVRDTRLRDVPAPVALIDARPGTTPADLAAVTDGKRRALWVSWNQSDTDPWGMVPFLLDRDAAGVTRIPFTGYLVRAYDLDPAARPAGTVMAKDVRFGDGLRLTASTVETRAEPSPADEPVFVTLDWEAMAPLGQELKAGVRLQDAGGTVFGQADRLLWNDRRLQTDLWQPGETARSFSAVQPVAGTPPGVYDLVVTVYESATDRPLPSVPPSPVVLGRVQIGPPGDVPAAADLPLAERRDRDAGGLRLLGWTLLPGAAPGTTVRVEQGSLLPLVTGWSGQGERPIVVLAPAGGADAASIPLPLPEGRTWAELTGVAPRLVAGTLRIPADLPPGTYELALEWGGAREGVTRLEVAPARRSFDVPPVDQVINEPLGEAVSLAGYSLAPGRTLPAGTPLDATLVWQARGTPERDLVVFLQALDGQGRVVAQQDGPAGADGPMTSWVAGQVIRDERRLTGLGAGTYRLIAGLYDPLSGQRARTPDGRDFLDLGEIVVR